MKHLGVNTLFLIPGEVGGSETYLKETLAELLPLLPCPCTLFTNRENDAALRDFLAAVRAPHGVSFSCLGFSARNRYARIVREQTQLALRVRQAGCDRLWSPGYTACLFPGCPQVVSVLDMQYRRFREDLSPLAWLATHTLVSLGVRRCRRVIAISEFSRREVVELAGVPAGKTDVTPLGVKTDFAEVVPARFDEPYLLSVAASYPHKNLPQLVRAFDLVADKIPHRLKLAGGRGLGEGSLEAAIAGARFKARIDRVPHLPMAELRSLYKGADVFVLPSLYEGFGIPVVEAQRAQVPVVATNCASLPEVGGDGVVVYDHVRDEFLAEAILRVVRLPKEERAALVARGVANAERFTWRECARLTLDSLMRAGDVESGRRN